MDCLLILMSVNHQTCVLEKVNHLEAVEGNIACNTAPLFCYRTQHCKMLLRRGAQGNLLHRILQITAWVP